MAFPERPRKRLKILEPAIVSLLAWGAYTVVVLQHRSGCSARDGTAAHLISQLDQAVEAYQFDYGVYPPGDGTGSRALVEALTQSGPRKQKYFEFPADHLTTGGDVVNPVWADGESTIAMIYYRLNAKRAGAAPPGGGVGNQPNPQRKSKFDIWCAGCDYTVADPKTRWSINNW